MESPPPGVLDRPVSTVPRLHRVLTLWDLIYYGMITIGPIAPITIYGPALTLSDGHAIITLFLGMIGAALTAISYGRMASVYPSAGSAYVYVGRALDPHLGFLAGSAMLLEYLVMPQFCVVFGALNAARLLPHVPYVVLAFGLAAVMTTLNLLGIRSVARANQTLLYFMFAVFIAFIVLALRYVLHNAGLAGAFSFQPIYNAKTYHGHALVAGTSFAALNYLGFESVTTMAEDAENPRRNVMLATVLCCVFIGIFSCLIFYLGQLVWPNHKGFTDSATAFMDVTRRVGGHWLFVAMTVVVIVAVAGSGLSAQASASRLLFGLGRDNVLPREVFTYLDPKRNTPQFNIWMTGLLALAGSLAMGYEFTAQVLTLAAFLGYMGVNAATVKHFYFASGNRRRVLRDLLVPGLGAVFCLAICWGFDIKTKIAGGAWLLATLVYDAIRTRGFRLRPVMVDLDEI
jgi:putrescine importer